MGLLVNFIFHWGCTHYETMGTDSTVNIPDRIGFSKFLDLRFYFSDGQDMRQVYLLLWFAHFDGHLNEKRGVD